MKRNGLWLAAILALAGCTSGCGGGSDAPKDAKPAPADAKAADAKAPADDAKAATEEKK